MDKLDKRLGVDDLSQLLEDRVFVDYFNVYLSLPIFSQRLLFKYAEKDFEFDPPLSQTKNMMLKKTKVICWILDERIPFFMESYLYMDYLLNSELRKTSIKINQSSHDLYRSLEDAEKVAYDVEFLSSKIGHVMGMCRFREYLCGTAGDRLLQFWIDAEQINNVPASNVHKRLWLWRELQIKYFRVGGLIQLKENQMWEVLKDGSSILEEEDHRIRALESLRDTCHILQDSSPLKQLQCSVLQVLKDYWLHKYMMGVHRNKDQSDNRGHMLETTSTSDLTALENMRNMDRALKYAQGKPVLSQGTTAAKVNWRSLFPGSVTEQDQELLFQDTKESVATVHTDGTVSVEETDPNIMDKLLHQYTLPHHQVQNNLVTSTDKKGAPIKEKEKGKDLSLAEKIKDAEKNNAKKKHDETLEKLKQKQEEKQNTKKHETSDNEIKPLQRFIFQNQNYLKGFMDGFSPRLEDPSAVISYSSPIISTARVKPHVLINPAGVSELEVSTKTGAKRHKKGVVHLPPIEKPINMDNTSSVYDINDTRVQEALQASRGPHVLHVSQVSWDSPQALLQKDAVAAQTRVFLCALAADQMAGGPFEAFLVRMGNPQALRSLHFWRESIIYLSTKNTTLCESYNHIRLRRCKHILMKHLETIVDDLSYIPVELSTALMKELPQDRGDEHLRRAQASVTGILQKAWRFYLKVDNMLFQKKCVESKRHKVLLKLIQMADDRRQDLVEQARIAAAKQAVKPKPADTPPSPRKPVKKKKEAKNVIKNKVYSLAQGTMFTTTSEKESTSEKKVKSEKPSPKSNAQRVKDEKQKLIDRLLEDEEGLFNEKKQRSSAVAKRKLSVSTAGQQRRSSVSRHKKKDRSKSANKAERGNKELTVTTLTTDDICDYKGISHQRRWLALHLTLYISRFDLPEISSRDGFCLDELTFDYDNYGSLYIKKTQVQYKVQPSTVQKPKRVLCRLLPLRRGAISPWDEGESGAHTPKEDSKIQKVEEDPSVLYENWPSYARPYRSLKDGKWVMRPHRPPISMLELFMDPLHYEFFKRFLQYNGSEIPLGFWEAAEQLKSIKEAKIRHHHVSSTFRRYFLNKNNFSALDCTSDVLRQLTQMDKVTPALLYSAQAVMAKDIEKKWYAQYLKTFPEDDSTNSSNTGSPRSITMSTTSSERDRIFTRRAKEWAKNRAGAVQRIKMRQQWRNVIGVLNKFRNCLNNIPVRNQYLDYLSQKVKEEAQKFARKHHQVPSQDGHTPIKKTIREKSVDMLRLANDIRFLSEVERYIVLCEDATQAAIAGTYGIADHAILERKAAAIIEVFIDSEVSPRIQINITHEAADSIRSLFHGGMVDRTIFHEAVMSVYPHSIYLYQKYMRDCNVGSFSNSSDTGYKYWSKQTTKQSLDFFDLPIKRVRKHCEDEHPKLQFSLMFGAKLFLPPSHFMGTSSLEEMFPELVEEVMDPRLNLGKELNGPGGLRVSSHTLTVKKRAAGALIKTKMQMRRNAVIAITHDRDKKTPTKLPPDVMSLTRPFVYVKPKPYKSVSSL